MSVLYNLFGSLLGFPIISNFKTNKNIVFKSHQFYILSIIGILFTGSIIFSGITAWSTLNELLPQCGENFWFQAYKHASIRSLRIIFGLCLPLMCLYFSVTQIIKFNYINQKKVVKKNIPGYIIVTLCCLYLMFQCLTFDNNFWVPEEILAMWIQILLFIIVLIVLIISGFLMMNLEYDKEIELYYPYSSMGNTILTSSKFIIGFIGCSILSIIDPRTIGSIGTIILTILGLLIAVFILKAFIGKYGAWEVIKWILLLIPRLFAKLLEAQAKDLERIQEWENSPEKQLQDLEEEQKKGLKQGKDADKDVEYWEKINADSRKDHPMGWSSLGSSWELEKKKGNASDIHKINQSRQGKINTLRNNINKKNK